MCVSTQSGSVNLASTWRLLWRYCASWAVGGDAGRSSLLIAVGLTSLGGAVHKWRPKDVVRMALLWEAVTPERKHLGGRELRLQTPLARRYPSVDENQKVGGSGSCTGST